MTYTELRNPCDTCKLEPGYICPLDIINAEAPIPAEDRDRYTCPNKAEVEEFLSKMFKKYRTSDAIYLCISD